MILISGGNLEETEKFSYDLCLIDFGINVCSKYHGTKIEQYANIFF